MLKNKVIKPFTSPYIFNIVIVRKKDGTDKGIDRICINYTSFNKVIKKDNDSIPIIKEYLSLFYRIKWLIILDLVLAY